MLPRRRTTTDLPLPDDDGFATFAPTPLSKFSPLIKCAAEANPDPSQITNSQTTKSKLVFEMLSHLTLDEMKACPDTEEVIQAAIEKKKGLQTENSTAMSNIVDQDARARTTELQKVMVEQLKEGKVEAAQTTFEEFRDFSIKQADRLRDLIDVVMNKYRTTDPRRYEPLERIPKSTLGQQQLRAPASHPIEDQVKFQTAAASWGEMGFQEKMSELVGFFNGSGEPTSSKRTPATSSKHSWGLPRAYPGPRQSQRGARRGEEGEGAQ